MKTFKQFVTEGNPLARVKKNVDDDRHFVGMSAERSHLSPEENAKRMKELKKRVRAAGYGFKQTRGKWEGGSEASIVVHANGSGEDHGKKLKQDMKRLASEYDQDAIFYHSGKEGKLIGTNKTGYPGKGKVEKVGKVRYNRSDAPFQTAFKKGQSFTTGD